jgi:hypothetical protein
MDEYTNIYNIEPTVDDAAAALLKNISEDEGEPLSDDDVVAGGDDDVTDQDAEEVDETEADEDGDETEGDEGDEGDDPEDDADEAGEENEAKLADPEADFEITVGDSKERVKVKDLARLYGQEKALTQRSQQIAEERKIAERKGTLAFATLERQITRARERADKYKDIDLSLAAAKLPEEEYTALKEEIESARGDVAFFENEAGNLLKAFDTARQENLKIAANAARSKIMDSASPFHIADWNDTVYNEILTFGVSQGLDVDGLKNMVDPAALKVLHKLMTFEKADKARANVRSKVKSKVAKAPKRAMPKGDSNSNTSDRVLKKLQAVAAETGSVEDVARMLAAR